MLNRANVNGLIVPLRGYEVHVIGTSPAHHAARVECSSGLLVIREAGAQLVPYSAGVHSKTRVSVSRY